MSLSESALSTEALLAGTGDVLDARVIAELRMLEEMSGTPLLRDLIVTFRADESARLAEIRAALRGGDLATVRALAHGVRGSAGAIGAKRVRESATELEEAAVAGGAAAVGARIDRLVEEWDRALVVLARVLELTRAGS